MASRAALLAEWESAEAPSAPLTPGQRDSIIELSENAGQRQVYAIYAHVQY